MRKIYESLRRTQNEQIDEKLFFNERQLLTPINPLTRKS